VTTLDAEAGRGGGEAAKDLLGAESIAVTPNEADRNALGFGAADRAGSMVEGGG